MLSGFDTLRDVLNVLIIPIVLALLAVWLPSRLQSQGEKQKRDAFVRLIRREVCEMEPQPPETQLDGKWWQHLKKRFIHEEIFRSPSLNRDFILSLDPDLAYWEAQLWIEFDKGTRSYSDEKLGDHARLWCDYLERICRFLDETKEGRRTKEKPCEAKLYDKIYKPWYELVNDYRYGRVKVE